MLSFLLTVSGALLMIPIMLGERDEAGPVEKSLTLQIAAIILLNAVFTASKRATDNYKFPPLLLVVYFQVDFYQLTLLLSIEDLRPSTFVIMILISCFSSDLKNCGLLQYLAFFFGFRKTNVLVKKSFIRLLKRRISVDSLCEILAGVSAFLYYIAETRTRKHPGVGIYNVTVPANEDLGLEGSYFITEECTITCAGWSLNDGIPPPRVEDIRSGARVFGILAIFMFIRLSHLLMARTILDKFASICRRNSAAVVPFDEISSDSELSPDNSENPVDEESNDNISILRCSLPLVVTQQIAAVHDAAVSVFQDVSFGFLLLSFIMAVGSAHLGLRFTAFSPSAEGVVAATYYSNWGNFTLG